jgi:hypothetical protein
MQLGPVGTIAVAGLIKLFGGLLFNVLLTKGAMSGVVGAIGGIFKNA